jgi:hypothetical protein
MSSEDPLQRHNSRRTARRISGARRQVREQRFAGDLRPASTAWRPFRHDVGRGAAQEKPAVAGGFF